MAAANTTKLTFRIEPEPREALRATAEQEQHSLANMIEVMICQYCAEAGGG